jgi:hypothetical protein
MTGQCRLCHNEAELRDSHFISQAAYRLVRGEGPNLNPVVIRPGKALQTSYQIRGDLLCHSCEQRLSTLGEDAFFRNCYRGPGDFGLLNVLRQLQPVVDVENATVYSLPESYTRIIEQIAYFGVSLFWKATLSGWRDGSRTLPPLISLGSYQEPLRRYLAGEGPFPDASALVVSVYDERNEIVQIFGTPATTRPPTNHLHYCDIRGVHFDLFVGSRLPPEIKMFCLLGSTPKYVLGAKRLTKIVAHTYGKHMQLYAEYVRNRK